MIPIRFGDDLELDLQAYELRRAGRRLRLERIPMEILRLLVEQRDQLVTREQIVLRVWGEGVFVDTDNSINVAIRKIRNALRDDPEDPRFIRTVTGKGYRFIAPIAESPPSPPLADPAPALPAEAAPARRRWAVLLTAVTMVGALAAYLLWPRSTPSIAAPGGRVMLAVLPFENLTGDPREDYFSDGLTEEMIGRLGNLAPERLGIIARTSVMHYKHTREPLSKVAAELGVHYVLEGTVRRDPEQVRITAQLIRVEDQTHLWARQYDREPTDVLRVQAEIARAIADEIQLTFDERGTVPAHTSTLTPQDYQAYDHYLEGRYAWNERTSDGFRSAVASFQRAIAKKPDYAQAYAGLADCYALMSTYGYAPQAEAVPKARAAALRALEIDERLAAAHTSLALINETYDWDWPTAESRFQRALALDPNYVTARHWYAEYLALQGRFDEALAEIERARQLDPLSLIIAADHGAILHYARRYQEAIGRFRSVLAVEPTFGRAQLLISSLSQQGRYAEALAYIEKWRAIEPGPWTWVWGAYVHGRAGHAEEARRAFQEMEKLNERFHLDPIWLYTTADLGMGQKDGALTWLQKACTEHSSVVTWLKVDPIFDPLRDDPRFTELLRCAHLER